VQRVAAAAFFASDGPQRGIIAHDPRTGADFLATAAASNGRAAARRASSARMAHRGRFGRQRCRHSRALPLSPPAKAGGEGNRQQARATGAGALACAGMMTRH